MEMPKKVKEKRDFLRDSYIKQHCDDSKITAEDSYHDGFNACWEEVAKMWQADVDEMEEKLERLTPVVGALRKANQALDKLPINVHGNEVWINSRVKGSAMFGLQDASKEFKESFRLMAELRKEAMDEARQVLARLKSEKGSKS